VEDRHELSDILISKIIQPAQLLGHAMSYSAPAATRVVPGDAPYPRLKRSCASAA
jgi:hypothetical protein